MRRPGAEYRGDGECSFTVWAPRRERVQGRDRMNRHICIHGHFYQPPRENAWLEAVEIQDSAYPYHDWNERITDEGLLPECGVGRGLTPPDVNPRNTIPRSTPTR